MYAAIRKMPKMITTIPEIILSGSAYAVIADPISPAEAPMRINSMENPRTKKMLCRSVGHTFLFPSVSIADAPARLAR